MTTLCRPEVLVKKNSLSFYAAFKNLPLELILV